MKTTDGWRQHLSDLVNARLDPVIYAIQWARDARCMQHGVRHRRVGAFAPKGTAFGLWAAGAPQLRK